MKRVALFDTVIGTSNLGDDIIYSALEEELGFLLDESFIMKFGTHVNNFDKKRYLSKSKKIQFAYDADFKIIMGTNLLSRDIKATRAQWPIDNFTSWLYKDCILAGVGTTLSEGKITPLSRKIYNRILRKDFYHSVRDEESKRMLEELGIKALNTGCPTLWKFTPDFCKQIPTKKSDRVVFSLSGYDNQRDRANDQMLIDVLRENYDELIFWCQTNRDEEYLDSFPGTSQIPRICSLNRFRNLLNEGNLDYVGTRLHGGVFAMQNLARSIIIAIDHRARGFHETNNLCICEREEIKDKLADMINGEIVTDIVLRQDDIDKFKKQFLRDYPKTNGETHYDLWYVKALRIPRLTKGKIKKIYRKTRRFGGKIYHKIKNKQTLKRLSMASIKQNKIMFFTFQGDYVCNPKYISEEIIRRGLDYEQVWVSLDKPEKVKHIFPQNCKVVRFNTEDYYRELSTSKILIENAFNFAKGYVGKKEKQVFIQTMHGSLGLKKIGPEVVQNKKRNDRGFRSAELTDICISNSSFENMVYTTSFWKSNKIMDLGHARNDIFFLNDEEKKKLKSKVCKYFAIPTDKKIALFASTFRNESESTKYEEIDFVNLKISLEKRFGGDWIILNRAHHTDLKKSKVCELSFVLNANEYPDIQELMIAIDLGITDYSSWICDYVLTYKPGLLYTPDLDTYDQNRGFYYPIEETPFPICKSNNELAEQIINFDEELFKRRTDEFLEARGCIDDGKASKRIVDMIEEIMRG